MGVSKIKKEQLRYLGSEKVHINYIDKRTSVLKKGILEKLILKIVSRETHQLNYVNINLCSDEHLLKMNKLHLSHNYYTDIITFQLNNKNEPIEADIYISLDRVKDNAKSNCVNYTEELYRVIIHGILHCCGYKDKSKKDIKKMREKENEYLLLRVKLTKYYVSKV
jgi:rRNA maturation RNase YbeY